MSSLPREARVFVKKQSLAKQSMARARKTHGSAEPKTLNQLDLVGDLRRDSDNEDWVLYEDPPEEQDRLVVFANNDMLHNMSGAEILLMDGMFDAFAMLPKKDTKIYSKLLEKIIHACNDRGISPPNPDAVK